MSNLKPNHSDNHQKSVQVILKPLSPPELEEVVIVDKMFPVGRYQQPFVSYDKTAVAHLSRQHARIFEVKGAIFIADAGSKNGTKVNGEKLQGWPVRLARGDEICFGGTLSYRVNISEQTTQAVARITPTANIRLTLTPTHAELETVAINRFPFLISKFNNPLSQYTEKFPQDITYVSRRHAYFFLRGDQLFLKDSGSRNGTYVNGIRLDEHARLLKNGDLIEIGCVRFGYTAEIEYEDQPITTGTTGTNTGKTRFDEAKPQSMPERDRTTFVSAADSFLDIFCAQEDEVDPSIKDDKSSVPDRPPEVRPAKTRLGRSFQSTGAFFKQLKAAFADDRQNRRGIWLTAGVACIVGAAALTTYSLGETKREIESLMKNENYQQSLALANKYLATHPHDDAMIQIATEALIKSTIPQWLTLIEQHDYALALELITQAKHENSLNKDGAEIAEILQWVTNLERFIHGRGGIDAPVAVFSQEGAMTNLLDWWKQDEKGYGRSLALIANYVPEFKDTYSRVFSNVRALRGEKKVYVTAIDRFKATIEEKLDSETIEELGPAFNKFETKYPRIKGMDKVRRDLESYLTLKREVDNKNLHGVIDILSKYDFEIAPFKNKLETMRAKNLPTHDFVQHYVRASVAWREGESDDALTLLSQPVNSGWQALVTTELNRRQQIVREFEALRQSRGTQNYDSRLIAFYNLLDDNEDRYYLTAIESEFKHYKQKMTGEADKLLELASKGWAAYQQAGGIRGLQRLEASISPFFKKQAKRLSETYIHAKHGIELYEAINLNYRPEWKKVHNDIKTETELQRRSLKELGMVLKPSLLNDKLELLPE